MTERYNKHMGIVCQIPDIPLTSPAKNGRQTSNLRRSAVFGFRLWNKLTLFHLSHARLLQSSRTSKTSR